MITKELIIIFERLKELPAQKLAIQKEILALQIRKDTIRKDQKTLQNKIISHVNNEVDENNKAKYSNAEKRQIEADSRMHNDPAYITLTATIEDIENKINSLIAEHEEIKDTIRVYEIISRFMGA